MRLFISMELKTLSENMVVDIISEESEVLHKKTNFKKALIKKEELNKGVQKNINSSRLN